VSGALKLAQAMLNAAMNLQPPLVIDGLFGTFTETAIRAMRAAMLLPDDGGLDARAWLALATAAPFPALEQGLRNPPMSGPPVALVQRLLNMATSTPTLAEDGVYTPATPAAVSAFQGDRGLPQNGTVDLATWLELAPLFDLIQPTGAERVSLGFDRARANGGGPAFVLLERDPLDDVVLPPSDPLDESWAGRSGLWLELQDSRSQPLFRLRLGQELTRSPEVPPGTTSTEPIGRPGPAIDETRVAFTLPIIPAVRRLVVFGTIDPGDNGPAAAIAVFEPW
jgi:peptidoglycan hydrolase-like protein with peptidoglycan-binding domain